MENKLLMFAKCVERKKKSSCYHLALAKVILGLGIASKLGGISLVHNLYNRVGIFHCSCTHYTLVNLTRQIHQNSEIAVKLFVLFRIFYHSQLF